MRVNIIILVLLSLEFAYNIDLTKRLESGNDSGCLTDELYGDFTDEELTNLINRRRKVRKLLNNNLEREELNTLNVPIVFHNLYKVINGEPIHSYCDYGYDVIENNEDICNNRMLRSLEVLNAQYLPANVQFILHSDYSEMKHDTIPGFDGFYEDATGGNSIGPTLNMIKGYYNVPNALNIYTHECLPGANTPCNPSKNGFSTYPTSLDKNEPGVFIKHKSLPGSADTYIGAENSQVGILAHEIGHFFSMLHINGIWFNQEGNIHRELASGTDCEINGDQICDTPGSPGYVPLISDPDSSWYLNSDTRECIYHGYGGSYNPESGILKIGGYNKSFDQGFYPDYNYCEKWGFDDHYGLEENCRLFTNYDNQGMFFGTRYLPEECLKENKSEYATTDLCHVDQFLLPFGQNFMQAGTTTLNYCSPRPIGHADYNASHHGFTIEQSGNIRASIENDYTGCNIETACNYDSLSYMLFYDDSICRYPCSNNDGCLSTDGEYNSNHNLYDCEGKCINDIDNDDICDNLEVVGCQDQNACNYNELATDADICEYPKQFYNCADECLSDSNEDGICDENIADCFSITGIYPNPFNKFRDLFTTIWYGLCQESNIQISIYNVKGRLIKTLVNKLQTSGYHSITWIGLDAPNGIYFIQMTSENLSAYHKIILIK